MKMTQIAISLYNALIFWVGLNTTKIKCLDSMLTKNHQKNVNRKIVIWRGIWVCISNNFQPFLISLMSWRIELIKTISRHFVFEWHHRELFTFLSFHIRSKEKLRNESIIYRNGLYISSMIVEVIRTNFRLLLFFYVKILQA